MAKTILNFHFDYWNPSLIKLEVHIVFKSTRVWSPNKHIFWSILLFSHLVWICIWVLRLLLCVWVGNMWFLFIFRLRLLYCFYVSPYLSFFIVWSGLARDRKPQDSSFTSWQEEVYRTREIIGPSEHNTIRYHSIFVCIAISHYGAPFDFQYQDPVFCKEMDSIPVPDIKPSFSPLFSSFSLLGSVIPFSSSSFRGEASSTSSPVLSDRSCRLFMSMLQPLSEWREDVLSLYQHIRAKI